MPLRSTPAPNEAPSRPSIRPSPGSRAPRTATKRSRAARAVLDAAEGALSAFNPPTGRRRCLPRVHAALRESDCARCTAHEGLSCWHGDVQHGSSTLQALAALEGLKSRSGCPPTNAAMSRQSAFPAPPSRERARVPQLPSAAFGAIGSMARQASIHASRLHGRSAGAVGQGSPPADGGHEDASSACRLRVPTGLSSSRRRAPLTRLRSRPRAESEAGEERRMCRTRNTFGTAPMANR